MNQANLMQRMLAAGVNLLNPQEVFDFYHDHGNTPIDMDILQNQIHTWISEAITGKADLQDLDSKPDREELQDYALKSDLSRKANQDDLDSLDLRKADKSAVNQQLDRKLDRSEFNQHFRGLFMTVEALEDQVLDPMAGDYAHVDAGVGHPTEIHAYDVNDAIWRKQGSTEISVTSTDSIPEGNTNLYFLAERVKAVVSPMLSLIMAQIDSNQISKYLLSSSRYGEHVDLKAPDGKMPTSTLAIGSDVYISKNADYSLAIGSSAQIDGYGSTSVGVQTYSRHYSVALGLQAQCIAEKSSVIGSSSSIPTGMNNSHIFGYKAAVTGGNQIQLGNADTTTYTYGAVQNRSDHRDKADITDCTLGLDFINAIKPRKWRWDYREDYIEELFPILNSQEFETKDSYLNAMDIRDKSIAEFYANPKKDGSKVRSREHYGLVAHELKSVADAFDIDFSGYQDHSLKGGLDVKSVGYVELIAPLIKAIQELSAKVTNLEEKI